MTNDILNGLNVGEHVVEIQECVLHDQSVVKVTIYKCISISWLSKHRDIETYEFPFYFKSKEIAEDFLQYYKKFEVRYDSYWDERNKECYTLRLSHYDTHLKYYMVDDFKHENRYNFRDKCQLGKRGVWNGIVNTDGQYYTYERNNINFKDIFKFEDIATETNKSYIFKMIENE